MPRPPYGPGARHAVARMAAALVLVLPVLLGGCASMDAGAGSTDNRYIEGDGSSTEFAPEDRVAAPEVSGETLDGDPIALADFAGSVVVVNFWASWCSPCRAEKPVLEEVYTENSDAGVEFLGVNIKDNRTAARTFERNLEVPYPSLYDQPGAVPQAFRDTVPPQAIPSTLVIDAEGRIAARVIGAADYGTLSGIVESVLEESGA